MLESEDPIFVKQEFSISTAQLWSVITQLDDMRGWFFKEIPAFKPEKGFATQFDVSFDDKVFSHLWEIIEVITEQKITYRWQYDRYDGDSTVTFSLLEIARGCILTLTHTFLADFPSNIPEFSRESCENGWQFFIQDSLKNYLRETYG